MEKKSEEPTIQEKIVHQESTDSGINSSKACLFNLIVYTQDAVQNNYYKKVIYRILDQFPCRIFFITGSSQEKDLNLEIASKKEKEMIYDCITIEAGKEKLLQVPYLLLPLLILDLPIYLLWGADPTKEKSILPYFEKFSARIIFDSRGTIDLQSFGSELVKRCQSSSREVIDIVWARISGWREVFSQTYDSPERLEQLKTSASITIYYNHLPESHFLNQSSQAIYLQAWIASRLGWQWKSLQKKGENLSLAYTSTKGTHHIELTPITNNLFIPGEILEMEVAGIDDYLCNFKRKDTRHVEVNACNQFQCELPFSLLMPALESGRSLMQEIIYQKISDHYLPMMQLVSSINWGQS